MSNRANALPQRIRSLLTICFGGLVTQPADGTFAVCVPGRAAPVLVAENGCGETELLQVYAVVCESADWNTEGLADFLLRENRELAFGCFQRYDEAIVLEHNLFATTATAEQLRKVILAMAITAAEAEWPLRAMGASVSPSEQLV